MNLSLRRVMDATLAEYKADPRITGARMYGSVGGTTEDEHSDVDPASLVKDDDLGDVDAEIRRDPGTARPARRRLAEEVGL